MTVLAQNNKSLRRYKYSKDALTSLQRKTQDAQKTLTLSFLKEATLETSAVSLLLKKKKASALHSRFPPLRSAERNRNARASTTGRRSRRGQLATRRGKLQLRVHPQPARSSGEGSSLSLSLRYHPRFSKAQSLARKERTTRPVFNCERNFPAVILGKRFPGTGKTNAVFHSTRKPLGRNSRYIPMKQGKSRVKH